MEAMLSPYRVLDLTEGGYLLAGKLLGDLGADVIKIEPPGGSPSRSVGPFYKDIPDIEKSLSWFCLNTNKRGITLNIERADGKRIFEQLTKQADIILESFPPGHMNDLGLGYDALSKIKPDIILTSVSPYGQEGPKARYKDAELTCWASGVVHYITGDEDRPPVWISWPNAHYHGGLRAVSGALSALWHREMTGEGQHVDVAVQQYLPWSTTMATGWWECMQMDSKRMGPNMGFASIRIPLIHPCKDGFVHGSIFGGSAPGAADSSNRLVEWMDEQNMAPAWMKEFDFYFDFDMSQFIADPETGQATIDRLIEPAREFFLTKTTAEWEEGVVERGIMGCPVSSAKEIAEDPHLAARGYWQRVEHEALGDVLTYLGPCAKLSQAPMRIYRRPPRIGEHNLEVYEKDLGLSRKEVIFLKQSLVI